MIVKCIFTSYEQMPSLIYEHGFDIDAKLNLTAGKLYAVYGFLYGGFNLRGSNSVQYFIVDDLQTPFFYSAYLFEMVCPHLYGEGWSFNHQVNNDFLTDAILGYKELATDSQYFDDVISRNIADDKIFQPWKISIDKATRKAACPCNVILE